MRLIDCENLSYAYDNHIVVSDVTFSVDQGDYITIVGENGSGKSTLIKGLLGLKKAISGVLTLDKDLKSDEIGYLPQQTTTMKNFPASVYEVVLSGRLGQMGLRPFYNKEDKQIALENLEKLGILDIKHKSFMELSGGQRQRVLLARGLCSTKKIFILDEPVSGLDPIVTAELYDLIKAINKTEGITIIMITHDVKEAVNHSNRILHLANKQLFYGSVEKYKQSPLSDGFVTGGQL